jgi:hypothetical protein
MRTLYTLIAEVRSENGTLVPGVTVEWILNRRPDAVGDIVYLGGVDPLKMDNTWGTVKTDKNGQAQLTITSAREGDTYIMVYVSGISNKDNSTAYTVKSWVVAY